MSADELQHQDELAVFFCEHGHDGPGWYFYVSDYPDEGSSGAYRTRAEAEDEARAVGVLETDDRTVVACEERIAELELAQSERDDALNSAKSGGDPE